MNDAVDVMQGTLDVIILKALSLNPAHGWGVSDYIERMSGGAFRIGQGSLYPALHRFETRGWVTSHWHATEKNRVARFYQLTPVGRQALADELARWSNYAGVMQRVIDAT